MGTLNTAYLYLHRETGIEPGDTVKLLRRCKDDRLGWKGVWTSDKTILVGKELIVIEDRRENGFVCKKPGSNESFHFPFYVLELIKKAPKKEVNQPIKEVKFRRWKDWTNGEKGSFMRYIFNANRTLEEMLNKVLETEEEYQNKNAGVV